MNSVLFALLVLGGVLFVWCACFVSYRYGQRNELKKVGVYIDAIRRDIEEYRQKSGGQSDEHPERD